jgi:hypothetical protein
MGVVDTKSYNGMVLFGHNQVQLLAWIVGFAYHIVQVHLYFTVLLNHHAPHHALLVLMLEVVVVMFALWVPIATVLSI